MHLFVLIEVTFNYADQRCGHHFTDTSFVPPLIYAVMGSSRDIAIGPVAVVSLLLGTLLQNEIDPKTHPLEYRRLAFTATFFAGVTQAALGFFR
jgi:high affinity sulfate transporter 1